MRNFGSIVGALVFFAGFGVGPVTAQEPAQQLSQQQFGEWFGKAARAYESQDVEAWVEATKKLHELRPYNQDFMRHLVEGHARLGELQRAYDMMLKMQQQGLAQDWDQIEAVEPMRQHRLYDHLNGLMKKAGEPFGDTETWSVLDNDIVMPEALAWDAERERMFLGTVRNGEIYVRADEGDWEAFLRPEELPQLQSVFDLATDEKRGLLWVATGTAPQFQGPEREDDVRSSLLKLDLESGELEDEYPLTSGSGRNLLGSLVVAGDGTVFAADTQSPVIYRLDPGAEKLKPFFGHQNFTSLRGLALSDDDELLYVADYELGIFVVDAGEAKQAWKLAVPDSLNEGGIDGLFWWDGNLVAIQNAITPQRVVRLQLGDDGLGVTAVAPIAAAQPEFDMPTFGTMVGQDLYFLAASHWQYVDGGGDPVRPLPEVPIMKIDVDSATVRVVGQEVLEQLRRQEQNQ